MTRIGSGGVVTGFAEGVLIALFTIARNVPRVRDCIFSRVSSRGFFAFCFMNGSLEQ
jgi:hypothetical protein